MKTKKTLLKSIILFSMGICLSLALGCSGEDGETGAQGPAGKDGVDGQDGQDGNANVIASEWIDIEWTEKITTEWAYMAIPVEGIMEYVENGGIAMMYLKTADSVVVGLPFTSSSQGGSSYYFRYGKFSSGESEWEGFRFTMQGHGTAINIAEINYAVRYVLVPANMVHTNGLADKMPESYEEAVSLLELNH
ncbi:MAG: collagen-like protein [Muricauda sp.]|nr:hypothetical protein [Allomuricauda sp.]MBA4746143.1 collagen-like protein [Allomuricauda sp.]